MDQLLAFRPQIRQSTGNFSGIQPKRMAAQPNFASSGTRRDSIHFGNVGGSSPAAQVILRDKITHDQVLAYRQTLREAMKRFEDTLPESYRLLSPEMRDIWRLEEIETDVIAEGPLLSSEDPHRQDARRWEIENDPTRFFNPLPEDYQSLSEVGKAAWRSRMLKVLSIIAHNELGRPNEVTQAILRQLIEQDLVQWDLTSGKLTQQGTLLLDAWNNPHVKSPDTPQDSWDRFRGVSPAVYARYPRLRDLYDSLPQDLKQNWKSQVISVLKRIDQGDQSVPDQATEQILPWLFDEEYVEMDGDAVKITKQGTLLLRASDDPGVLRGTIKETVEASAAGCCLTTMASTLASWALGVGLLFTPFFPVGIVFLALPFVLLGLNLIGIFRFGRGKLSGLRLMGPFLKRDWLKVKALRARIQQAEAGQSK